MENDNLPEIDSVKLVSLYQEARIVVAKSRNDILSLLFMNSDIEKLEKLADHAFVKEIEKYTNYSQVQECQERSKRKDAIKEEIYKRIEIMDDDDDPEWQNLLKIGKRLSHSNITVDNVESFFRLRDFYLDDKKKSESLQEKNIKLKKQLEAARSLDQNFTKLN